MTALRNKVAIVTGAGSGIGRAAARLFARQGAKVVVSARRAAPLEDLVEEIGAAGGEAVARAGDVGAIAGLHALGRLASPEEIAHTALYLASDASSFTTGTILLADGGISIQR